MNSKILLWTILAMTKQEQITELRNHIQNLIRQRDKETQQNIIESITDDIRYYQNQIDFLADGNLSSEN